MERLTFKLGGRNAVRLDNTRSLTGNVADRLAAYEDTGFTPEQIAVFPYRKEFAYADYMKELFPKMERAEELSAADKEGRLAVIPCKVGDMAYYFRGTTIYGDTVERIVIDGIGNQIILNANRAYLFCDVGRNLFFSYAEAEAALKKRKEESN